MCILQSICGIRLLRSKTAGSRVPTFKFGGKQTSHIAKGHIIIIVVTAPNHMRVPGKKPLPSGKFLLPVPWTLLIIEQLFPPIVTRSESCATTAVPGCHPLAACPWRGDGAVPAASDSALGALDRHQLTSRTRVSPALGMTDGQPAGTEVGNEESRCELKGIHLL